MFRFEDYMQKELDAKFEFCHFKFHNFTREGETSSPQPEPAEEHMEASEPEPSDPQEPVKDMEADVTEPEAGSGSEAAEETS